MALLALTNFFAIVEDLLISAIGYFVHRVWAYVIIFRIFFLGWVHFWVLLSFDSSAFSKGFLLSFLVVIYEIVQKEYFLNIFCLFDPFIPTYSSLWDLSLVICRLRSSLWSLITIWLAVLDTKSDQVIQVVKFFSTDDVGYLFSITDFGYLILNRLGHESSLLFWDVTHNRVGLGLYLLISLRFLLSVRLHHIWGNVDFVGSKLHEICFNCCFVN